MLRRSLNTALIAVIAGALIPAAADAQWWRRHPAYLHAMSNLRKVFWLLRHRGPADPMARDEENVALRETRAAYQELLNAAIMDDYDIDARPPATMNWYDHRGRLHHVVDLLRETQVLLEREEEDPAASGLRDRAIAHIKLAARATDLAIQALGY